MQAKSPEEICGLFQESMAQGDIDGLLSLYDPEAVILDESGEVKKGREGLRQNLVPFRGGQGSFRIHDQADRSDGEHCVDAHQVECVGPADDDSVCDRTKWPVVSGTVRGAGSSAIHLPSAKRSLPRLLWEVVFVNGGTKLKALSVWTRPSHGSWFGTSYLRLSLSHRRRLSSHRRPISRRRIFR